MFVRSLGPALAVALLSLCGQALAQPYAVISFIGSELTIVHARPGTGSSRDTNVYETAALADPVFDRHASAVAEEVLRKQDPNREVLRLSAGDKAWVAAVRKAAVEDQSELSRLIEPLAASADKAGAKRLLLVLPARQDIRLSTSTQLLGTGKAAGLGMYADRDTELRRSDTGEEAPGMLGMFANVRLAVLDIGSRRIVAEETFAAGSTYSMARAADANPLNALTAEQKVRVFERILRREIEARLPSLLDRSGR